MYGRALIERVTICASTTGSEEETECNPHRKTGQESMMRRAADAAGSVGVVVGGGV